MELDYRDHSLVELAKKVNSRELSAEELIKASLKTVSYTHLTLPTTPYV